MHVVILFHNIGGYHAARLRSTQNVCMTRGWSLTVIQETDRVNEHPWGDINNEISFPLRTLISVEKTCNPTDGNFKRKAAAKKLTNHLNCLQPDILIIPGWGFHAPRAAIKWAKQHRALAVLMSESKWDDERRSPWKEKLKSFYIRQFQSALVGGQLHKDYLIKLGMPDRAIFLGYDVVVNDYCTQHTQQCHLNPQEIRQKIPQIPEQPYFIAVTRFIPRKNVIVLVKAFAKYRQLLAPQQAWDLVICGSGEELENISHCIRTYNLEDCIHLPGFQTYQVLPYWFGLASAFIHPALSEQWGLVVNEALASGLPAIVSNRCGCYPELIQEEINGFGFDPENIDQLAKLMFHVSSGEVDLIKMHQMALTSIQQFTPERFAEGLMQAIDFALSSQKLKEK
jgi:glycosyltransferase involved in cell wall biosynthesis